MMKKLFFVSATCSSCIVLLLYLTVLIAAGVDAQNTPGDGAGIDEKVLYSNQQFYTPSEQEYDAPQPESVSVVGLLFNMRSKLETEDAFIYIKGFEFYTTISGTVYYELSSREGAYYDQESGMDGGPGIGSWKSFDMISSGMANGSGECIQIMDSFRSGTVRSLGSSLFNHDGGNPAGSAKSTRQAPYSCPLTVVPEEDFTTADGTVYPWSLKAGETRSFYITLASTHLMASPSNSSDPSFDSVVAASTPDLDLYEGVAARTYPLHETEGDFYFNKPMGFVGKVHYIVGGAITNSPTSSSPSFEPSPSPTTSLAPTVYGATRAPTTLTYYPTTSPTLSPVTLPPTPRPTRRCRPGRPCLQPPTLDSEAPTPSPLISSPVPRSIDMMVYIENVPGRVMEEREQEEYEERMMEFLKGNEDLKKSGVKPTNVKIFHHNLFDEEEERRGGPRDGDSSPRGDEVDGYTYIYNMERQYVPRIYPAIYVMTTVEVLSKLPFDVTAFYLWEEMTDHEMELIELFNSKSLFVSYFRDVTNMTYEVVDGFSKEPTSSPTVFVPSLEEMEDEEAKAAERRNLYAAVGIGLGILWCFLALCSFRQIIKHRRIVKERGELRRSRQMSRSQSSYKRRERSSIKSSRFSIDFSAHIFSRKGPVEVESALGPADRDSSQNTSTADESPGGGSRAAPSRPTVSFSDDVFV